MVGVPTHYQLFNPTLRALRELGGSASVNDLSGRVIEDFQPPQEVIEQPHPEKVNQSELEYRLAWARTYLKTFGLKTNSTRGVCALAPEGVDVEEVDPRLVVRFVQEQSRRKLEGRIEFSEVDGEQTEPETDEEEIASWRETRIATLLEMPPGAFEILEATRDGEQLIDKLKDLRLGVATKQVEVVEVNTDWFAAI
jgi:restriction system protein